MASEEKKFSLDELPDEGSSPVSPPPKRKSKPIVDPRVTAVKARPEDERTGIMTLRWLFDRPEKNVGWMIAVAILFVFEQLQLYSYVLAERAKAAESTMGLSEVFYEAMMFFEFILIHPFILVIFIPLIFKLRQQSDCYFELSFDGIHTIRSLELVKGEQRTRVRIKWNEISAVTKTIINKREVLQIHSPTGKVGELIFDLDMHKKMAIKQIVNGLIHPSHPFRVFMEKEIK